MAAGPKSGCMEERQQEGVGAGEPSSGLSERQRAFMIGLLIAFPGGVAQARRLVWSDAVSVPLTLSAPAMPGLGQAQEPDT